LTVAFYHGLESRRFQRSGQKKAMKNHENAPCPPSNLGARPGGFPGLVDGFGLDFARSMQEGTTTLPVRVSGSTRSRAAPLSNGITGAIAINRRFFSSPRALNSLPSAVRARLLRR
jgi:hypothetical protein